jgi:FkbM family methyltransferase
LWHFPRYLWRRFWRPDLPMKLRVQGVEIWMPRSHTLPYFTAVHPKYGQNLVGVAAVVAEGATLQMIDIGANIGDSALQVSAAVESQILCIEGDPHWTRFLHMNVDGRPGIEMQECFVTAAPTAPLVAHRIGGTSHLVPEDRNGMAVEAVAPRAVLAAHDSFRNVRLIKSDTDGFDTTLVVGFAEECHSTHPVLFFEYDPTLTKMAGDPEPALVWKRLASLGYTVVFVWDNFGTAIASMPIGRVAELCGELERPRSERTFDYWDVAVVHSSDHLLASRLLLLMPAERHDSLQSTTAQRARQRSQRKY